MPSIQELFEKLWSFDPLAYCSNPQKEEEEFCNNPQTEEKKSISKRECARQIRADREDAFVPLDIDRGESYEPPARQPMLKPVALTNKDPETLERPTTPIEEIPDSDHVTREDPRELAFKVDSSSNPFTCCAATSAGESNEIDLAPQKEQQPTPSPQMIVRKNSNDYDSSFAQLETFFHNGILFRPL